MDEALAAAKERAWREVAAIEAAHARGEIDDDGWHREMAALVVPTYLSASDVRGGSGHTGTADDWEWSRGVVAEVIERRGTFLDVGCANGLLMESVASWAAAAGLTITPYGVDISPELADAARRRLPHWFDHIFTANALGWTPPFRFDTVRTGLEYVPPRRRRELVAWLLDEVVAPGGRLIVGKYNEEIDQPAIERELIRWGFGVAGRAERAHRVEPRLAYRAVWIDRAPRSDPELSLRAMRRTDVPRMQQWLAQPHVKGWWNDPPTNEDLLRRIEGTEPTHVLVIEHREQPVGWVQWYRWRDYPAHAAQLGAGPDAAGLDLAIGDAERLGHGLGPRAIHVLMHEVIGLDPTLTACVTDPDAQNLRSLRCFEKAGFVRAGTVRLPGEPTERCVVRRDLARR